MAEISVGSKQQPSSAMLSGHRYNRIGGKVDFVQVVKHNIICLPEEHSTPASSPCPQ